MSEKGVEVYDLGAGPSPRSVNVVRPPSAAELLEAVGVQQPDMAFLARKIDAVSRGLFAAIGESVRTRCVPVIILRGGLLMLDACRASTDFGPWGLVLPVPHARGARARILHIDVPQFGRDSCYVLVDPIVNSGDTVIATLQALDRAVGPHASAQAKLACVFLTSRAENAIGMRYPYLEMFAVWDGLSINEQGWVNGVRFDAGDCAMGGREPPLAGPQYQITQQ